MKILVIICSRNPQEYLIENVNNIKKFYKDAKIIIIDSDSDDMETYNKLDDVEIHYVKNKNYEMGAYKIGYEMYPDYDIYMCLQDSSIITSHLNLNFINNKTAYITQLNLGFWNCDMEKRHAGELLKGTELNEIYNMLKGVKFTLVEHNNFIVNNEVMKDIIKTLPNLPQNKGDSCAYERILGLYFIYRRMGIYHINNIKKVHGNRK